MNSTKMCRLPYESIFSYLLRLSNKYCISILEVWGQCNLAKAHPIMQNITTLIHCPTGILDIDSLSNIIGMPRNVILDMSFYNLLKKFEFNIISKSKIMVGLIHSEYHYCPKCLSEYPYHQLLWSISKIEICKKHGTRLKHKCVHCKQAIKLKDVFDFSHCPYCGESLKNFNEQPEKLSTDYLYKQNWLISNFIYLLDRNDIQISRKEFSIKLLFLLNERRPEYDRNLVVDNIGMDVNLSMLLQHARESQSRNRHFNLSSASDIIYKARLTFEEFFSMNIPIEFYDSLYLMRLKNMTCYAPWCNYRGHLSKSSNSSNSSGNNRIRYYLTCYGCGCRYGVDLNNTLIERTSFINLFAFLSTIKERNISIKQMAKIWGISFGRILRAIAYFDSRGVLRFDNYHIEFDERKLLMFLSALESNMSFDEIKANGQWNSFFEFLYYRYNDRILKAELAKQKPTIILYFKGVNHEFAKEVNTST